MKIIYYTAMQGRHDTVRMCLDYNMAVRDNLKEHGIELSFIYGYTTDGDDKFLSHWDVHTYFAPNNPLHAKFNGGMDLLESMDYDCVLMMGSDDIADVDYYLSIQKYYQDYDHIALKDIYFHDRLNKRSYYWPGYNNHRQGEPAGAGKVYTRQVMDRIKHDLFRPSIDRGLDYGCWTLMQKHNAKIKLLSVKKYGMVVDIKDSESLTKLRRFSNLEKTNLPI